MAWSRALWLVVCAGCSFQAHGTEDGAVAPIDSPTMLVDTFVPIDAIIDAPGSGSGSGSDCSWSVHFDGCAIPASTAPFHLQANGAPYVYDTSNGGGVLTSKGSAVTITTQIVAAGSGSSAALWSIGSLQIDSNVQFTVIGSKPLIIAAGSGIQIDGVLDAGSHSGSGISGAGANPASCGPSTGGTGGSGNSGTGGGGGGGYSGAGGAGGSGDFNCTGLPACIQHGGAAGVSIVQPRTIAGGCSGGASGGNAGIFAHGGVGGGAILLASKTTISVNGRVLAGGGGGSGDTSTGQSTGGGGGGAGGFIGLEAPQLTVAGTAVITANGGGGGGGDDVAGVTSGGADGRPDGNAATGGLTTSTTSGTSGGLGSTQSNRGGSSPPAGSPNGGGGGGGGGAGFIQSWTAPGFTPQSGSTISPPFQNGN
jgi:hypothetical protein